MVSLTSGSLTVAQPPVTKVKSVTDHGAVGDGVTDDSGAFTDAMADLPAAGGTITVPSGTYKFESEVEITKDSVALLLATDVIIEISEVTGSGTANVVSGGTAISGFKISANDVTISGGRITSTNSTFSGKNIVGVLDNASTGLTLSDLRIDGGMNVGFYCGNETTDLKLFNIDVDGCTNDNIKLGYDRITSVTGFPQLNKAILMGVTSTNSLAAGLSFQAHADDVQVIGGFFYDNGTHGIEILGGEFISIMDAHCYDNTQDGIIGNYGTVAEEEFGLPRNVIISGCILSGNSRYGIHVQVNTNNYPDMDPEGYVIVGNLAHTNQRGIRLMMRSGVVMGNIVRDNTSRGFDLLSCRNVTFVGNVCAENDTVTQTEGWNFGQANGSTPPKGKLQTHMGNVAVGTGIASGQQNGWSIPDSQLENSVFYGNVGYNHNSNNISTTLPFTNNDVVFRENFGHTMENSGTATSISTGGTVAHGCVIGNGNNQTPAFVSVMSKTAGPTNIRATVSSSNITISFDGGGSHDFYWSAKVVLAQ